MSPAPSYFRPPPLKLMNGRLSFLVLSRSADHLPENPFARLSTLISDLTSLGHLDVYSMTRESLQRMLPAEPQHTRSQETSAPGGQGRVDMRAFEYRFSKGYLNALPPAQRPVEREVFGEFPLRLSPVVFRATS